MNFADASCARRQAAGSLWPWNTWQMQLLCATTEVCGLTSRVRRRERNHQGRKQAVLFPGVAVGGGQAPNASHQKLAQLWQHI